ncbi:MAG: glycoside hydrolase family 2 [Rhodospirillales bacterium]|nr:glycoside hydrolase family 2 [Rhodospirillales bacterium]
MRREIQSLDGKWDFAFCGDRIVALDEVASWRTIHVPGPWQAQHDDLRERNGRAWYRRQIEIAPDWVGASVYLRFGAVNYFAVVYVNGVEVGRHEGGYLPFEFEIGGALRAGTNAIAVHVTAPTDDPDAYPDYPFAEVPFGKQSWYGPLGGIWQSVSLERRSADHIAGIRVRPSLAEATVEVDVRLARPLPSAHHVEVDVSAPSGELVAAGAVTAAAGAERAKLRLTVPTPRAWSPEEPNLYRISTALRKDELLLDEQSDAFGFRTVEVKDGRIHLNGAPIYLRAALDQDYYPDGICTPPSEGFLEDQFRKAKELGLNCLRCHIKVPDPRYYAVADRVGLLVWTELPNTGRLTEASKARLEATLRGIVERDGNHPSIICWTIINENWGTDLVHDATHRAWLNRTYHWLKEFDPTRLVVDNSPLDPSFHVETDIQDFHFYAAIPDHRASWEGFVERMASRPDWTHSPHGDARRSGKEPLMCSEFGNWGLPNPELLRDADGREPWWFETGHDWGEGVMYPHGVQNRFRAAGLESVFGTFENFVEAAQWQQYRALKFQIETMRRRPELAGYVITEFTDCHWESNGLLDMRRNPRAFHHAFAAFNAETVVVPRWERLAYWSGERVAFAAAVANGGGAKLEGTELRWSLDAGGIGDAAELSVAPVSVSPEITAAFDAPSVERAEMHRVELELDRGGDVLATNHLDLAIFPKRVAPPLGRLAAWSDDAALRDRLAALGYAIAETEAGADVLVLTHAGEDVASKIRNGASVVLLLDAAEELQPIFPHWQAVRVVPRQGSMWLGAWASTFSWVRRKGAFARLPGGPLIDHTFDRVIPGCVIANCNTWDFQSRVHAGIVVGWVHKPAALVVEREYGRGKMAATTLRLLQDPPGADPVATTILDALIEIAVTRQGEKRNSGEEEKAGVLSG